MANYFTTGDLVVSVYGDGNNDGTYTDNQASPVVLQDYSTTGTAGAKLVLPMAASGNNYAVSGEYGSSSEGSLSLSTDGKSLTIAGYGVNAASYNAGGAAVYGNAAEAQSTSVQGGTYTAVPRVFVDVKADGTVDSSTAAYNIYNTNNPRSIVTDNGSSFYTSGQGVSGDKTQGVFLLQDGVTTTTPTAIDTSTDTRSLLLNGGTLYVSRDSKQPKANPADNVGSYGGEPTTATAATPLAGINQTAALANANGNTINNSSGTVHLSPENFFFANATTLYVADSGNPKGGGLGDGGLQKYTLANGTYNLDYTLSAGLNLKSDTTTDPGAGGQATTGLIGLTGKVNGDGTVSLYATNATVGDLNQTYLYGINDTLADTTAAQAGGETFQTLATAAPDTNIRGVAFAPQAAAVCFAQGTHIATIRGEVAVEHLRVGDLAITASGEHRPIRWLGHQTHRPTGAMQPRSLWPVRVAAGAFGDNKPSSDLTLSPGHSICLSLIDDVLVPIQELVNGSTVAYVDTDEVTYWHVELDSHDVLIANGMPAESFLEMGANRAVFVEGRGLGDPSAEVVGRTHADFCRRFVDSGPLLAVMRDELALRAATMGCTPLRDVAITCFVDEQAVRPRIRDGEALFAVPAGSALRIAADMMLPALRGETDDRTVGIAVYSISVSAASGEERMLDLDDPAIASCFHPGERESRLHYRWSTGDIVLPANLTADLEGALLLRVVFEPSTVRGWSAPPKMEERPKLRLVG